MPRLGHIRRPSKHKQPDDWERGTEDLDTIRFYLEIGIMWLGQHGRKLDLKHFQMLEARITYALRVVVVRSVMLTKSNDAFFNDAQETSMFTMVVAVLYVRKTHVSLSFHEVCSPESSTIVCTSF